MQRAIAWSWELLDPGEAQLLCALTVFAQGFSADAVFALVGEPTTQVQLRLDGLIAHSLVHSHAGHRIDDDVWRFGLYQPIREFAAAQLDAAGARHWRTRLRAWALRCALLN